MDVPSINVWGIIIAEPFTWLTNWLVAAFCFYFGHVLFHDKEPDLQKKFWSLFLFFIAVASIFGGTAHGFILYFGNSFHLAAWLFTGLAIFCAQMASLSLINNNSVRSTARIIFYVELIAMAASVLYYQSFEAVRINSIVGLLGIVTPIQLIYYFSTKARRNKLIVFGILCNLFPAIVHGFKISINQWFNFNDISHILMIGCFYLIFLGASTTEGVPARQYQKSS